MTDPFVPASTGPVVPATTAVLPGGGHIPLLGFGTWQLTGETATSATTVALQAGYRHLDTAHVYGNEAEVGAALRGTGRDGVFVTTKLPPARADQARATLEQSLQALGVEALDLWLVHWPAGPGADVDLWGDFLQAQADGLARDVGVSNYSLAQLDELLASTGVMPALNQIPWSPLRHDPALVEGHRERGVVLEGYSGLKGGVLEHPTVTGLAKRLGRTPAQVVLRWHLEHEIVVIPRSQDPARIRANADLDGFRLDPQDVAALDALGAA